ncbi:MarR family transcriptional regulator [Rhodococcus sp. G-MC3]|uniref:MarR family winged helix-turn-helix transcriptional regulator n=1 Tax=Rhodococcus sp. G-MC3 TaxID=3046209 RepID=UPI0024BA3C76|nr:MarR family transcriptional regulator [Rhodococcus sp. G-MC3]MDJ0396439.1 MarR family transcriptional regulator [Rhodococcus sp. G-MC3]
MTWARYEVLELLDRAGPSTCVTLARALGRHRTTVGVTVTKLEQHRLIERTADPSHTQKLVIALTPAGRKALARAHQSVDEIREMLNDLDTSDDLRTALVRLEPSWTKIG